MRRRGRGGRPGVHSGAGSVHPFDVMAEPQQSDAEPVDDVDTDVQEPSDEDVAKEEEPEVETDEDSPASFRSVGLAAVLAIAYPIIA